MITERLKHRDMMFLLALLTTAVAFHVGPNGASKLVLKPTHAPRQRLTIVAAEGSSSSSASPAATRTQLALKTTAKKEQKLSETQKRMMGRDGNKNELDEEWAESHPMPEKYNLILLQDDGYSKAEFSTALCDVIQGMKPKRAAEIFAKLETDKEVFVCVDHRERAEFYIEQLARKTPMIFAEAKESSTGLAAGADNQQRFVSSRNS